MNVTIILGHPDPNSFNHAIAATVIETLRRNHHQVAFHDLYQERFDPLLLTHEIPKAGAVDPVVARHCTEVAAADGIIIIHPNWWGQPPAIVKGWVDRVLRPGVAYEFLEGDCGEGIPIGLLRAHTALVFNTSNTPHEREQTVFGDPLENLWNTCTFDFCGVKTFYRRMFTVMVTSSVEQRTAWLLEAAAIVDRFFPAQ